MATINSGAFKFVLVLHLLAAIVGFGALIGAGVMGARAAGRGGREGTAMFREVVNARWAEWVIYSVPILGIILILLSDDFYKFSDAWVSYSFLLVIIFLGVLHGAHLPNLRRMDALMGQLSTEGPPPAGGVPPQASELADRGRRAGMFGGILNLILIALVALMVWRPA